MYESVEEFFRAEHAELVPFLENPGHFWNRVIDNSIPGEELLINIGHMCLMPDSNVCLASYYVARARLDGKLPLVG